MPNRVGINANTPPVSGLTVGYTSANVPVYLKLSGSGSVAVDTSTNDDNASFTFARTYSIVSAPLDVTITKTENGLPKIRTVRYNANGEVLSISTFA